MSNNGEKPAGRAGERSWPHQGARQTAALAVVLLSGGYGLSGAVTAKNGAVYSLAWLLACLAAFLVWLGAAYLWTGRLPAAQGAAGAGEGQIWSQAQARPADAGARAVDLKSPWAALPAALYLLLLAAAYLGGAARLWRLWALPTTPFWLLLLLQAALALYGAHRGCRATLRLGLPVCFVLLLLALLDTLLLLPQLSFSRLAGESLGAAASYLQPGLQIFARLMAALPALLLLAPTGRRDPASCRESRRALILGGLVGLVYLLLVALRASLLLGSLLSLQPYPILRSLMLAQAGPGLSRLEWWGVLALSGAMLTAAMACTARAVNILQNLLKNNVQS